MNKFEQVLVVRGDPQVNRFEQVRVIDGGPGTAPWHHGQWSHG